LSGGAASLSLRCAEVEVATLFGDPLRRRVCVFSHPNHEGAVLGLIQRLRPHLLFLTDGGGERRVDETRRALGELGLLDRARFLDCTEQSFYDALLDGRSDFFLEQAKRVRGAMEEIAPEHVFCDAVEFYNPVHDVSLPIVRAALAGESRTRVFEVPLIYQEPGAEERYAIQRLPESEAARAHDLDLTPEELQAKLRCRKDVYHMLRAQLPQLDQLAPEHLGREVVADARTGVVRPDAGRVLRYEWRGARLREAGAIERVITYRDHYAPVASELLAA
jgi:hypothetical protein